MKVLIFILLLILAGCNSDKPGLTSIQGIRDPNLSSTQILLVNTPALTTYLLGETFFFSVVYSDKVKVTGMPKFPFMTNTGLVYADYDGGSETDTLYFKYTVPAGVSTDQGIKIKGYIELNGGTIKNVEDNSNVLNTYPAAPISGILINAAVPTVTDIFPITPKTYGFNQIIDFKVTYNIPVTNISNPQLKLNIGGTTHYASYISSPSVRVQVYRLLTTSGMNDLDGVEIQSLVSGSVQDSFGNPADLSFTKGVYPGLLIDTAGPVVAYADVSASKTYYPGDDILITLHYGETVTLASGPPTVPITLNTGGPVNATYLSGSGTSSLVFKYTVSAGQSDIDGVDVGTLSLNGAQIKDSLGNIQTIPTYAVPDASGVRVDGIAPTIVSVFNSTSTGTYTVGQEIRVSLNTSSLIWSSGSPKVKLNIGGTIRYATCDSVSGGANTTLCRYQIVAGDQDLDGYGIESPLEISGGTFRDGAPANANSIVSTFTGTLQVPGVLIDGILPSSNQAYIQVPQAYKTGDTIDFIVPFNKSVTVTGTPRLKIRVDQLSGSSNVKNVNYHSGSSGQNLVFRYTVDTNDLDFNGITYEGFDLNGGTIEDSFNHPATLNLSGSDLTAATVAPSGLDFWYDVKDLNFASKFGNALNALSSKIDPSDEVDLSASATYATASSIKIASTEEMNLTQGGRYIAVVFTLPTTPVNKSLFVSFPTYALGTSPGVTFLSGGQINAGSSCFSFGCSWFNESSWAGTDLFGKFNTYNWTTQNKRILIMDFNVASITGISFKGSLYDGEISEIMIFNSLPAGVINPLLIYLQGKHSAAVTAQTF